MTKNSEIKKEFLAKALSSYEKYKGEKEILNQRVRENEYWYKARYGKIVDPKSNDTQPVTAYLFSAIENKYADAIDNFPQPNILEREPGDIEISSILSKIIPVQLDLSDFKAAYKRCWRAKLKHGTGIYGIFYDNDDIIIKSLSVLNVYCDMHVNDVQDSQFLFIVNAIDNEELKEDYPEFADKFTGNTSIETFDGTYEMQDKTEIVDCYYKKNGLVHCMKLCKNEIISATEWDKAYKNGLYAHGKYPVVFDTLYPEEDCPFGFGIIDIAKNPQIYIDRLDSSITKNAVLSSKKRFMIKDNGSVNENEFLDYENDIIHVAGNIDNENIRELDVSGIQGYVMEYRKRKIDELKEIIGNRDFQQGGTNGGVTAASAISVLQESGNKLSRIMIDDAYDCYKDIILLVIELMREFYTESRIYRVTGERGQTGYAQFSNDMMFREKVNPNIKPEDVALEGILPEGWKSKEPIQFDVSIVPQKQNPFQREANNTTIMELWNAGLFNPENADMAVIALQAMHFDGKEKIIESLNEAKEEMIQRQQQMMQEQMLGQQRMTGQAMPHGGHQGGDELVPVEEGIRQAEAEIDAIRGVEALKALEGGDELVPVEETLNMMGE